MKISVSRLTIRSANLQFCFLQTHLPFSSPANLNVIILDVLCTFSSNPLLEGIQPMKITFKDVF